MRKFIFLLFSFLILFPNLIFAECKNDGFKVVYINGIFTEEREAKKDLDRLEFEYLKKGNQDVEFLNGFNPSHIEGLGDLMKSVLQGYENNILDYDLTTILRQVHRKINTKKVLLVGHSQGTFYTNTAYDYLIKNGVSRDSISLYNVATPADYVAGNGNYLTSKNDKVINEIFLYLASWGFVKKPLPANIDILSGEGDEDPKTGGHSFSKTYLTKAPDKIIGDIQEQINKLSIPDINNTTEECFKVPNAGLTYKLQDVSLKIVDKTASGVALIYNNSVNTVKIAYNFGKKIALNVNDFFVENIKSLFWTAALTIEDTGVSQNSESNLVIDVDGNDLEEDEGAIEQNIQFTNIDNKQDLVDDILEKIDLLKRQIAELEPKELISNEKIDEDDEKVEAILVEQIVPSEFIISHGGSNKITYPKILISEIQIGGQTDSKEEFVELYNPNDFNVDLTGWYVHRKTKTGSDYSTFVANNLFNGKKITSKGYFLIARQDYFTNLADIFIDNPLTEDNSLILKNPNHEIVDKVGLGEAQDFENIATQNPSAGQSIGRKGNGQDSDNNSLDFGINIPTPKASNIAYVPPPPQEPKDEVAPDIVFNDILAVQNSLDFTINFTIIDSAFEVSPSGVLNYIFRWREELGDWQEDEIKNVNNNPTTFLGTRDFTGNDEKNYYFQIKTKDLAGNESDWLPEIPTEIKISLPKKILINEIQIDSIDGVGGTDDDWIELYNPNDIDILLKGWSIQKHGFDDPCSVEKSFYKKNFDDNHKIKAGGFLLIVDTKSDDLLKNIADMTVSWSLTDNNTIYLVRSNDKILDGDDMGIVDKVGFGEKSCFFENISATSPPDGKSIERKKLGLDTDNNLEDFKISDETSPKGTFPGVSIKDNTNYVSSLPYGYAYSLLINWQSSASNIDFYDVQYRLGQNNWQDWLIETKKTEDSFNGFYSLTNDNVYYFRARAKDADGNLGDWSEISIDLTNPVIINELAYAGTNANKSDQWIELYNKSDKDVSLNGWSIVFGSSGLEVVTIPLQGNISANGYFVLERNDDDSLLDILANQTFTDPIGKNYIYLRDNKTRYIDQFYIPSVGIDENSFISKENRISVERVSAYSFGMYEKNWKFFKIDSGRLNNGKDREGGEVYGTPGKKNSVDQMYTYYENGFYQDTNLTKLLSPYLFSGLGVEVSENVTLSLESGVVIKFINNQSQLGVKGKLRSIGTEQEKIVFTSFYDDEYGGDTNDDGITSTPKSGDWLGIYFYPESKNSELEQVLVRYGGAIFGGSSIFNGNLIWMNQSSIILKNSILEKSKNRGIKMINSNSIIDNVQFLDFNANDSPYQDGSMAIFIQGGAPKIVNSYFKNNYIGIYIASFYDQISGIDIKALPIIQNNNFVKNSEPIILNQNVQPIFMGNTASENNYNAINLSSISEDLNLQSDLLYLVKNVISVPENKTLTLEPGVVINFAGSSSRVEIKGTLKAVGLPDNPIVFESYYYDEKSALPGVWLGLRFTKTSKNSELENVRISYGGAFYENPQNQDFTSAIKVEQSSIILKNSVIQKNTNNGIWLVNSPSIIDNVQFLEQNTKTVFLEAKGVYVQGGTPQIKNSFFKENYYGIYIDDFKNPDTEETVLGEPILENNQFEGSLKENIYYTNLPPPDTPE